MEHTYLSEGSRFRAQSALRFDASNLRKAWSNQKLSETWNYESDLTLTLPLGIEKLRIHGKQIIADLLTE
jgi:hypothetical protein